MDTAQTSFIIRKTINIAIRTSYYVFCYRRKQWCNPELTARVAYSIALTCLSATQAIVQLINSSERADRLLSKRTGVGFEPVTS